MDRSRMNFTREATATEVEIEQTVLALLLESSETAWLVLDRIAPSDMLEPVHQRAVEAVRAVLSAGKEPQPLTVAGAMAADAGLDTLGGTDYFRHIVKRFGGNAGIANDLCESLADQAQRRALASEISQTEARLDDMSVPAADILADHQGALQALAEGRPDPTEPGTWYESGVSAIEGKEKRALSKVGLLSYGIGALDDAIGGMGAGDVVILAGRPGQGKTALALVVAYRAARAKEQIRFDLEPTAMPQSVGVFITSLEMKRDALLQRGLSMRAYEAGEKVPYSRIRLDRVSEAEEKALGAALWEDVHLPIIIDDRRGQTVAQIGVRARRARAKLAREGKRLGLLVIDHLGLIEPDRDYRGNKVAELTEITRALKILAGSLDLPILCLCQLSRKVEDREDKKPYLSDLRDSGSIEQDADVVILIHRPEYYLNKSKPEDSAPQKKRDEWHAAVERWSGRIAVQVPKNRNGPDADLVLKCSMAHNWIGGVA